VRLALALAAAFGAAFVAVSHVEPSGAPRRETPPSLVPFRPQPARPAPRPSRWPPQFVVVSFDGAGGTRLWPYWRSVARRAHARFTFFVSGVYLLAEERRNLYRPPRHARGVSDIWFARPESEQPAREVVRGTLEQIAVAYREGHEIGTHFNGHFCEPYPGNVDEWTAADWNRELDQFDRLLFRASRNNGLRPAATLPFGPREIVGERTPCLQGRLPVLYRVLARRGFRYDASGLARLGTWPQRRLGIWSVPLLEIPFVGHDFPVVSMDYNFFANQTGAVSTGPAAEAESSGRPTSASATHSGRATAATGHRCRLRTTSRPGTTGRTIARCPASCSRAAASPVSAASRSESSLTGSTPSRRGGYAGSAYTAPEPAL
jgi:peptidoglycan/xylan/chitin deacetylase (PgdA/CDA1 family)